MNEGTTKSATSDVWRSLNGDSPPGTFNGYLTIVIASFFLIMQTARLAAIDEINETNVTIESGETAPFRHPMFQTVAGYAAEFIFCTFFYVA